MTKGANETTVTIAIADHCQWHSFIDYLIVNSKPKESEKHGSWKVEFEGCFESAREAFFNSSELRVRMKQKGRKVPAPTSNFLVKKRLAGLVCRDFAGYGIGGAFTKDEALFASEFAGHLFEFVDKTFTECELAQRHSEQNLAVRFKEAVLDEPDLVPYGFSGGPDEALGRKQELKDIHSLFKLKDINSVIVRGMAGMGKTYLSAMYAKCYGNNYDLVLNFVGKSLAQAVYSILKKKLGIKTEQGSPSDHLTKHLTLLARHFPGKMLVLIDDGATEIDQALCEVGKQVDNVHFLVAQRTTKDMKTARVERGVHIYSLESLTEEDALALYQNRVDVKTQDIETTKILLTEYLGGHPFMISVVSDWVSELTEQAPDAVLEQLKQHGLHNLKGEYSSSEQIFVNMDVALDVSYNRLKPQAKVVLLLLSLFPNDLMDKNMLIALLSNLDVGKDAKAIIDKLVKSSLLITQGKKGEGLIFHALMFDYLLRKWSFEYQQGQLNLITYEQAFTETVIKYIKLEQKEQVQHNVNYQLSILLGYMLPLVLRQPFNYLPSTARLASCLRFWYENTEYSQIAYDTTILITHKDRLSSFVEYVEKSDAMVELPHQIILFKMYAHYFYSKPDTASGQAKALYDRIEQDIRKYKSAMGNDIDVFTASKLGEILVHILDARMNTEGRTRGNSKPFAPIMQHEDCGSINDEILAILPASLKQQNVPIERSDGILILRAAHYWGHRGNQDQFTAIQLFNRQTELETILPYIYSAKDAFEKAAYYRLCALEMIINKQPDAVKLRTAVSKATGVELDSLGVSDLFEEGMETFESFYQGVGDTAHQFRGSNYLDALLYAYHFGRSDAQFYKTQFEQSYAIADALYKLVLTKDKESLVQYHYWMLCNDIIHSVITRRGDPQKLPQLFDSFTRQLEIKTRSWKNKYNMEVQVFIRENTPKELGYFLKLFGDSIKRFALYEKLV